MTSLSVKELRQLAREFNEAHYIRVSACRSDLLADLQNHEHGTSLEIAHDTNRSNAKTLIELKGCFSELPHTIQEKDNQCIHKINDCELKIAQLEHCWEVQQHKMKQKEQNDWLYNCYCVCMLLLLWYLHVYDCDDYIVYLSLIHI